MAKKAQSGLLALALFVIVFSGIGALAGSEWFSETFILTPGSVQTPTDATPTDATPTDALATADALAPVDTALSADVPALVDTAAPADVSASVDAVSPADVPASADSASPANAATPTDAAMPAQKIAPETVVPETELPETDASAVPDEAGGEMPRDDVYSVDVEWGTMAFQYAAGESEWSVCDENGKELPGSMTAANRISLLNRSTADAYAHITYEAVKGFRETEEEGAFFMGGDTVPAKSGARVKLAGVSKGAAEATFVYFVPGLPRSLPDSGEPVMLGNLRVAFSGSEGIGGESLGEVTAPVYAR